MKKYFRIILVALTISCALSPTSEVRADPLSALVRAAVVKVIKAIDLKIQRQQNKVIWLQNAQKVIENELSKLKLGEIADWTNRQQQQYQQYFDELKSIKLTISQYKRLKDVLQKQVKMVSEHKKIWQLLSSDGRFTTKEKEYMAKVYAGILKQCLENTQQILKVTKSLTFSMSDGERLNLVNQAADRIDKNYEDFLSFNQQNAMLSIQRVKDSKEIEAVKKLYGLN